MFTKKMKKVLVSGLAIAVTAGSLAGGWFAGNALAEEAAATVINPIAKYEFKDSTNPGKDSMGNYDLKQFGEGEITTADGTVRFNGNGLIAPQDNDISDEVSSFTLCFEIFQDVLPSNWAAPVSFGWNGWSATRYSWFHIAANDTKLRFTAATAVSGPDDNLVGNVDGSGNGYWGREIGTLSTTDWHSIALTVDTSNQKIAVYMDGAATAYSYTLPEGFSYKDSALRFSLGADNAFGNEVVYNGTFKGALRNVEFYDFAMTASEVTAYEKDNQLNATEKTYVKSATADYTDTVYVADDATDEEVLAAVASQKSITVTMSDDSTSKGGVTWTSVEKADGKIYAVGTLSGVYNPNGVQVKAQVGIDTGVKTLLPVAKYEFLDASNPGKDSMGNYHLEVKGADGGKVTVANGVATFDGTAGLLTTSNAADISEKLTAYTLVFKIQATTSHSGWVQPIGFGWNDWSPYMYGHFTFSGGSSLLRFSTATANADGEKVADGVSNIDGTGDQWWGKEIGTLDTTKFEEVALSVQPGGKITVYLNGEVKYNYDCPADYSMANDNMRFAIGCDGTWGAARNYFIGSLKDVAIYDFAMTAAQVDTVFALNKIKTNALTTEKYISAIDTANVTTAAYELLDTMSAEEMVAEIQGKSTVKATLSDETTKDLAVNWATVTEADGVYTAKGYVENTGIGLPTTLGRTEVTSVLNVKKSYAVAIGTIENGSVTLSADKGLTGTMIEITATANTHYALDKIFVDGTEIVADTDGKYFYTIGEANAKVTATFVPLTYTASVGEVTNGTVELSETSAAYGTKITITATPNTHFVVSKVYVNGEAIAAEGGVYSFVLSEDEMVVTADFVEAIYVVDTFVTGGNGTATADAKSGAAGTKVTVTVTANEGYEVNAVKVNGTAIEAVDGVYSFEIAGDTEVEVTFKEIKTEDPEDPENPGDNGEIKSGCGATMGLTVGFAVLALAGAALLRKKED